VFTNEPVEVTGVNTEEVTDLGANLVWENRRRTRRRLRATTAATVAAASTNTSTYLRIKVVGEVAGAAQAGALRNFSASDEFAQAFYQALLDVGINAYTGCAQSTTPSNTTGGVICTAAVVPPQTSDVGGDGAVGAYADPDIVGAAAGVVGAGMLAAALIVVRRKKEDDEEEDDLENPKMSKLVWSDSMEGAWDGYDDAAAKAAAQEQALQMGVAMGVAAGNRQCEEEGVEGQFSDRHAAALAIGAVALGAGDGNDEDSDVPAWMMTGWVIDHKEVEQTGASLGAGAFGAVSLVKVRGVLMAAKKLNSVGTGGAVGSVFDAQKEAKRRADLLAEARVLVELQHPNIVRVLGICLDAGHECVLMELAQNGTVRDLLDNVMAEREENGEQTEGAQPLPAPLLFSLLRDVILGMRHAHAHSPSAILHRDLKAANVLLSDQHRALVSDFGLAAGAADADTDDDDDSSGSSSGICGSLAYSPPEVLQAMAASRSVLKAASAFKKDTVGGWSPAGDVYSFGVLAYEMATGRTPYHGEGHTAASLFRLVVKSGARPHGAKWDDDDALEKAGVDPFVAGVISRCWAQDKTSRPTFEALAAEFEAASKEVPRFKTTESVTEELRNLIARFKVGSEHDSEQNDGARTTAGTMLDMLATRKGGKFSLSVSRMEATAFDPDAAIERGIAAVPEANKRDLTTSFLRFYSGMFQDEHAVEDDEESDEEGDPFGEDAV